MAVYEAELPGLRRRGARLWAKCPLHEERHASFTISLANLLWHCFGCGAGGDVIELVMHIHQLSFKDAARRLGAWGNTTKEDRHRLDEQARAREAEQRYQFEERQVLFEVRDSLHLEERIVRHSAELLQTVDDVTAEILWETMAISHSLIRVRATAYTLVAFGPRSMRREYVERPWRRRALEQEALEQGYVRDDDGRIMEMLIL